MSVTIATESLNAPVAHVALLKPREPLFRVSNSADRDKLFLAVSLAIERVAGADLRVLAQSHASGKADQFHLVEDRAVALVVYDYRAKLPTHLLAPVVACLLHQLANIARLRVSDQPFVVSPHQVPSTILR